MCVLSPPSYSVWFLIGCLLIGCTIAIGGGDKAGTLKRTLPAFNGELIIGSDAVGLRAPGSLLRPMIKFVTFECEVNASDHVLAFSTLCVKNVEQRGVLPICFGYLFGFCFVLGS